MKKLGKNEEWASQFEGIRDLSDNVLNKTSPEVVSAFIPWFQDQLAIRISLVEQTNADLTDLVMDMSESVAEISGHQPPQSVEDVGLVDERGWGYNESIRDSIKSHGTIV